MSEPNFGTSAAQVQEEIEKWAAAAQDKAQRYQQMQQEMTALSSSATSSDEVVQVTVDTSGALTELTLSDGIRRMTGAEVSAAVMSTIRQAQSGLGDQVAEVITSTVGDEDTATTDAMISTFRQRFPGDEDPAPPPEGDDEYFSYFDDEPNRY